MPSKENNNKIIKFKADDVEVDIQIPLPEETEADEYVAQLLINCKLDQFLLPRIRKALKERILLETRQMENEYDDVLVSRALTGGIVDFYHGLSDNENSLREDSFANKFAHLMHSSSGSCLQKLMLKEQTMAKQMANLAKNHTIEVEQVAKQCDQILANPPDCVPTLMAYVNDRLKQIYVSYSSEVTSLIEKQRQEYRLFVDKLYTKNGRVSSEGLSDFQIINHNDCADDESSDIDESFTVSLGAQLKSMHNVRLVGCDKFWKLCRPHAENSNLHTAMSLYGRSLSGIILLVRKHPNYHILNRTEFANLCEQKTELHFDTLGNQLEKVSTVAYEANIWRDQQIDSYVKRGTSYSSDDLQVGDVYCTKHSNLSQQVVFHLVGDDDLSSNEITSRHPVFSGIRNIIRMADRISLTHLYIPLLLIERKTESTTESWCLRRAEIVFKCIRACLMEVCGSICGGSPSHTAHYNIHFVVPNGLDVEIYHQLSCLLPTIFHPVPGVTADVTTVFR